MLYRQEMNGWENILIMLLAVCKDPKVLGEEWNTQPLLLSLLYQTKKCLTLPLHMKSGTIGFMGSLEQTNDNTPGWMKGSIHSMITATANGNMAMKVN